MFFAVLPVMMAGPGAGTVNAWDTVIENQEFTEPVRLTSSAGNNTLIRNCRIHDTGAGNDGIFLRSVTNVRIENCEIYNIDGQGGIRLSTTGTGTRNVVIENNRVHDVQMNGINAPQRSQAVPPVSQDSLVIRGNTIYNTGLAASDGLHHAIYCQAPDARIEGNVIYGVRDGNGISMRSSGVIGGNTVSGRSRANKPGIRYYSDHMAGVSDLLVIENNMVWNDSADAPCIELFEHADLYENSVGDAHVVKNFRIGFNTAVSLQPGQAALRVSGDYGAAGYTVAAKGNLLVAAGGSAADVPAGIIAAGNYTGSTLAGFVNASVPYDFHITEAHPAAGYAAGVLDTVPATDIDGDVRTAELADAGADQVSFVSRVRDRVRISGQGTLPYETVYDLAGRSVCRAARGRGVYVVRYGDMMRRVLVVQ